MDGLKTKAPNHWRTVRAHGTAVGLPSDDDMGNSEVGHNALGAGQVISQGAKLVDNAIANGSVFSEVLHMNLHTLTINQYPFFTTCQEGWQYIKPTFANNTVHFIGLLSDGGVHSRCNQLYAFMQGAAKDGAKRIRVHILTDGRDVPDGSGIKFIQELEAECAKLKEAHGSDARIASGGGRMGVTMDRYEADWNIVKKGWYAHVLGEADNKFTSAEEAYKTMRVRVAINHSAGAYQPQPIYVKDDHALATNMTHTYLHTHMYTQEYTPRIRTYIHTRSLSISTNPARVTRRSQ